MTIINIEILKDNCKEYARSSNAIRVLKMADGKNNYKEIAKIIRLHPTQVSGLLKKAEKLGLAQKNKLGVYKKISGVLGYMPREKKNQKSSLNNVVNIITRLGKTKKNKISIDSNLNIPNQVQLDLNKMANGYGYLYATENVLRELIRDVFLKNKIPDWWDKYVSPDTRKSVQEMKGKQPYHASNRRDELEYTHLGQLKEIITSKKNWSLFLPFLNEKDKSLFIATIQKAIPSRHAIGHCIPLKTKDLQIVAMRFEDILKMIK